MVLVISVWPFVVSCGILLVVLGLCCGVILGWVSGAFLIVLALLWWAGEDQLKRMGADFNEYFLGGSGFAILLFIFSEFMFFSSLLVSAFYTVDSWDSLVEVDMFGVPMLISVVLLSSGVTITLAHQLIHTGIQKEAIFWVGVTVALGLGFVVIQGGEWYENSFSLFDGVGGSLFYFITGFHGLHVIMGVVLNSLLFMLLVFYLGSSYVSFWKGEAIVWYWHFVDVVWLFVYLGLYWYCM
uniref:cytochrome c oxidase subunit III n=1 Tax=Bolbosoma nipponicum TaxID=1167864 RepID=UPI002E7956CC|nr:cytochrome c oxidase subunit III [Bolbosoma nipponicum]WPN89839.1 cytochrome c oxidase subunit III [Bolbosoma nipponicum]